MKVKKPSDALFASLFSLFKRNMKQLYQKSSWGWRPEKKRKEMRESGSMIVAIKSTAGGELAAFCTFQLVADTDTHNRPTIYCYELQCDQAYRGRGLGRLLMQCLEEIHSECQRIPEKIMLTCFTANRAALAFYWHLGFRPDSISPVQSIAPDGTCTDTGDCDYAILSKIFEK